MKSLLLFAISFVFFSPLCFAQVVWPGDVNNNGIVNEVDLLYLGFAFNESGSPRTIVNTDWAAQEITTAWEGTFPDGLNFVYADCNGDGIVDIADAAIIEMNLTKTHDDVPFIKDEILDAIPDVSPPFAFQPDNLDAKPGDLINLLVSLGSDEEPLSSILGLAFTINYEPKYFKPNSAVFELLTTAWISPFDNENTHLILDNPEDGKITVTFTATDKKPVDGGGFIGTVSFVIEDNIIDFLAPTDTVTLTIDSITVINDNFEKVPIEGAEATIDIEGRITSLYNPLLDQIKMYPNPNRGWILLQTNKIPIDQVQLVNQLGQVVYQKELTYNNSFHSLDLQILPEGMYWLQMITKYGTKSTPIQKL